MMWGALWRSENKLDGKTEYLIYSDCGIPQLFKTRKSAREWIEMKYGYLFNRHDLTVEPYGWKMPRAVKITEIKWEK